MNKPIPPHIEALLKPDVEFNDEVVEKLEGMVVSLARYYAGKDYALEMDLMQEGWAGVRKACDQYRDDKGASLKTYAHGKARRQMTAYLQHQHRVISAPRREAESSMLICIDQFYNDYEPAFMAYDWTNQIDLTTALGTLDELTRTLVTEHIGKGVLIIHLAAVHGMCRNRVSRIIKKGIEQLRRHML